MIKAKNLSYQIPYFKTILEDLNFEVKENEFIGLIGHNGSKLGKWSVCMDFQTSFKVAVS